MSNFKENYNTKKKIMQNILFRADSSSTIGTGHIMRDLVLAKQYPNSKIIFASQDLKGNINHKIVESEYEIEILKSNDIEELNKLIKKYNIDMIVIDHYGINYEYEKKVKLENQKLKILSFDDTYEKHFCDILLNHNLSADESRYRGLIPDTCELRCGTKYTLLREEFIKEKRKKEKRKKKKINIFLSMGGADHSYINIKILKVLEKFKNIKVNLVTTKANKNLEELEQYSKNKQWIHLYIDSKKIAKLMRKSNFSIVTPSVILNEIYFMGVPFMAIKTASNQQDMYEYVKNNKGLVLKKFNKNKLKEKLCKIL